MHMDSFSGNGTAGESGVGGAEVRELLGRVGQALSGENGRDPGLASDLAGALVREPRSAHLHNALGVAMALRGREGGAGMAAGGTPAGYFERAVGCDGGHVVARLNWAEALTD